MLTKQLFYAGLSFAPQTEHFPSAVIFGCSLTSALQSPHFKKLHLQQLIQPTRLSYRQIARANKPNSNYTEQIAKASSQPEMQGSPLQNY